MLGPARVFALALLLGFGTTAAADASVAERWIEQLRKSSDALEKQRYSRSLKIADRVIGEMLQALGPGNEETRLFATAVTQKALALAGMRKRADALWYWHTALNLDARMASLDLSPFRAAGAILAENSKLRETLPVGEERWRVLQTIRPTLRRQVEPDFPRGAYAFGLAGVIIVEVLVTADGEVTAPLVLKSLGVPVLSYATLEALRRFEFEPAQVDGKPVDAIFVVTVNYKR